MSTYRTIYKKHYGPIPKDNNGRSYEIHHIDGNRRNNDITNLECISIVEHYTIHYSQGDWGACLRMKDRMKLSPAETSKLASLRAQESVRNKTHPFLKRSDGTSITTDRMNRPDYVNPLSRRPDGSSVTSDLYKEGKKKNPFLKRSDGTSISKDRLTNPNYINPLSRRPDGSSITQEQRQNPNYVNPFAARPDGSSVASDFLKSGRHPSQFSWTCSVCGKSGKGKGNFTRFHKHD